MKKLLSVLLALAFLAAACGSSNEAADDGAMEETTTTTAASDDATDDDGTMVESDHCDAVKTPGTLTVATGDPVFPPWMEDDDPSNGRGFESAVVYAVADEIGLDVAWVRTTFDQGVAPGEKDYDFNIQQFSITDTRDEVVDFSVPYYVAQPAIIATDPTKFADVVSVADLKGLKLGAGIATTSLDYIENVIQPDTDAAVFDDNVAAKAAFDAGQIDGLVLDFNTAFYVTAVEIEGSSIVGVLPETAEGADSLGFVLEEGSELTPCLDQALTTLEEDGTLDALAEEYLQAANEIPTLSR
jgi:polar amino acid transport system substrate-binding protein